MTFEDTRSYSDSLGARLQIAVDDKTLFKHIVNVPFADRLHVTTLDLGIIVLLLVNKNEGTIDRIALSNTEMANNTVKISDKPFKQIRIPVDHEVNILSKAIRTGRSQHTVDWEYLFTPSLSGESARFNQSAGGIGCSYVYPLKVRDGGAMIFSFYTPISNISKEHTDFMKLYASAVTKALAR